jgi:small subunit ribosomal protein S6
MNYYENIVLLSDSLSEQELQSAIERIQGAVKEAGGQLIRTEQWGLRKLAYVLNKHRKGYYVLLLLQAPPQAIKKLEDFYKVFDPVFKFMVVKLGKHQLQALQRELQEAAAPENV